MVFATRIVRAHQRGPFAVTVWAEEQRIDIDIDIRIDIDIDIDVDDAPLLSSSSSVSTRTRRELSQAVPPPCRVLVPRAPGAPCAPWAFTPALR